MTSDTGIKTFVESCTLSSTTIRWPSGQVQQVPDLPVNQHLLIEEGQPAPTQVMPGKVAVGG